MAPKLLWAGDAPYKHSKWSDLSLCCADANAYFAGQQAAIDVRQLEDFAHGHEDQVCTCTQGQFLGVVDSNNAVAGAETKSSVFVGGIRWLATPCLAIPIPISSWRARP